MNSGYALGIAIQVAVLRDHRTRRPATPEGASAQDRFGAPFLHRLWYTRLMHAVGRLDELVEQFALQSRESPFSIHAILADSDGPLKSSNPGLLCLHENQRATVSERATNIFHFV